MSLQSRISALITAIATDIKTINTALNTKVPIGSTGTTYTAPPSSDQIGYFVHLLLNWSAGIAGGSDPEPFMVETKRNGISYRTFWLNENGSPRAAALNDEPALKVFGPDANHSYVGMVVDFFKAYGLQTHLWGIHTDGNARIGSNSTIGAHCVVVAHGAAAPAGLPNGTLIFELP